MTVDLELSKDLTLRASLQFERGDPSVGINDGWLPGELVLVVGDQGEFSLDNALGDAFFEFYKDRLAEIAFEAQGDEP